MVDVLEAMCHKRFMSRLYLFNLFPVNDMLQTAKQFARRCNLESGGGRSHLDGLTFGEFCVLLADFRRFR